VDGGSGRAEKMAREVAMLKRRGVVTIAIGIGYQPEGFEYGISVNNLNDLGSATMRMLCDAVARETAGA